MLTITAEEVEVHGFIDILGFTEDGTSFLHLSEEEFKTAKKLGKKEHIEKMEVEYYAHLKSIEENKKRLLQCEERRANRHKPKRK